MHYLGGKFRTAKKIAAYLEQWKDMSYLEPFCGGLWVSKEVKNEYKVLSDSCAPLISLYVAIQNGWVPPSYVTNDDYDKAKDLANDNPLKAFIGFGCSFSGKWFGGYARSGSRNYAMNAKNSLLKKADVLKNSIVQIADYRTYDPYKLLIYCDPPYENTTKYNGVGKFDSEEFWAYMIDWSYWKRGNVVVISSYEAPPDFNTVLEIPTKTDLHGKGRSGRVEKLFRFGG